MKTLQRPSMEQPPNLILLPGFKDRPLRLGAFPVTPTAGHEPPFPVQVRVEEEDTWRLLSAPAVAGPVREHPIRLMTDLVGDRPAAPGSVLVRRDRWLAIVHDLELTPSCREGWVRQALQQTLELARHHRCRSLALPLLGSVHGGIGWRHSLALTIEVLTRTPAYAQPPRVWLQIPAEHRREIRRWLEFASA